jgi:bifunctional DNA-binding transcriptional regulator/antitoxin component of YhaV-PrlF toxin-antitoxin module
MTRFVPPIVLACLFVLACNPTSAEAQGKAAAPDSLDGKNAQSPTSTTQATQEIPDEVRSKLTHNVGSSFLVFRDKAQEELKVTREQKEKLDHYLRELLPDAMQALRQSKGEREKYNQNTHEQMAAVLTGILNEGQRTRLHQLELQRDGLFGAEWNLKELQITDDQRKQFMVPTRETGEKIKALMEEIHQGANPDEIRPKVLKLRLELEGQLEALLTDAQKRQWKDMLGEPVDLGVLFDGVSSR